MPFPDTSSSHARTSVSTDLGKPGKSEQVSALLQEPTQEEKPVSLYQMDLISRLVLETVGEGVFCIGADGLLNFVNSAALNMLGWDSADLIGRRQHEVVHRSYADGSAYPIDSCPAYSVVRSGRAQHCDDEVFWRKDGTSFAVSYQSTPIFIEGQVAGAVILFHDISERVRRDRWQLGKDCVFNAITKHSPLDSTLQLLTDAYSEFQPSCSIAILLRNKDDGSELSLAASSLLPAALEANLRKIRLTESFSVCARVACTGKETIVDRRTSGPDGHKFIELAETPDSCCLALPMTAADGRILGVVAFMVTVADRVTGALPIAFALPVTLHLPLAVAEHGEYRGIRDLAQIAVEHRNLQTELVHQTRHDHLTGLPNWILMEERLEQLIQNASRNHSRIAVCSLDLDRFRRVNENHGHVVGDDLLLQITARFRAILRKGDLLGRQGGDEFIIVVHDLNQAADADLICRKLLLALSQPFHSGGKVIAIGANIGVSIYPDHAETPELLVQHADTALDLAKEKGTANFRYFHPDLGQKVRQLARRESALQTALQNKELYLVYQPLFTGSRQIYGFEALLRWQHPELGLVPPDQFIPLAEETGLILSIGDWVLGAACRQAMSWKAPSLADTKIFVNISALQLGQADFTHSVAYALTLSGLSPSRLELEVTESFIVPSFKKATQRLQPLQDLGVSIAIDDFGTGHSSLSVLHKLPINTIKVDRSFVSRIDKDASGLSTVRAIINLAHQLGMKTVGEGVETEQQFALLNDMECDYYQGYLLAKPQSVDAIEQIFGELQRPVAGKETPATNITPISVASTLRRSA